MPVAAVLLFCILSIDSILSWVDGLILLISYIFSVLFLTWAGKRGIDIHPGGEVTESLSKVDPSRKWKASGLLILSLSGIIAVSEMLVSASETITAKTGLSDTVF